MCHTAILPASFFGGSAGGARSGDTSGNNGNGGAGGDNGNANNAANNFNKVFGIAGRKLLNTRGGQSSSQVLLPPALQAVQCCAATLSDMLTSQPPCK